MERIIVQLQKKVAAFQALESTMNARNSKLFICLTDDGKYYDFTIGEPLSTIFWYLKATKAELVGLDSIDDEMEVLDDPIDNRRKSFHSFKKYLDETLDHLDNLGTKFVVLFYYWTSVDKRLTEIIRFGKAITNEKSRLDYLKTYLHIRTYNLLFFGDSGKMMSEQWLTVERKLNIFELGKVAFKKEVRTLQEMEDKLINLYQSENFPSGCCPMLLLSYLAPLNQSKTTPPETCRFNRERWYCSAASSKQALLTYSLFCEYSNPINLSTIDFQTAEFNYAKLISAIKDSENCGFTCSFVLFDLKSPRFYVYPSQASVLLHMKKLTCYLKISDANKQFN